MPISAQDLCSKGAIATFHGLALHEGTGAEGALSDRIEPMTCCEVRGGGLAFRLTGPAHVADVVAADEETEAGESAQRILVRRKAMSPAPVEVVV